MPAKEYWQGRSPSPTLAYHRAMVLEELHELIETLQGRIAEHGAALQQSEALTRYALIDPLLRGLGWDTGDPSQVLVEYRLPKGSQKGYADYALLGSDTQPLLIVEAKSLHSSLDEAAAQALGYCNVLGIPHFAVTDGDVWRLFETFRPVALEKKLVVGLSLKGSAAESCLRALALWRPSVAAGSTTVGATPLIEMSEDPLATTQQVKPVPHPLDSGWQSLTTFVPAPKTYPAAVRLPSGEEIEAKWWGPFLEAITRWLSKEGHLTAKNLPIRNPSGRFVLGLKSDSPTSSAGHPLKNLRAFDQYLLNTSFQGAANASNARLIIKRSGQDPADFSVRLQ